MVSYEDLCRCYERAMDARISWERAVKTEAYVERCTVSYGGWRTPSNEPDDRVGDGVAELDMLAREERKKAHEYGLAVAKVKKLIAGLPEGVGRRMMTLRYVDGLTWEEVGDRAGYSGRHAQRVCKAVMEDIGIKQP